MTDQPDIGKLLEVREMHIYFTTQNAMNMRSVMLNWYSNILSEFLVYDRIEMFVIFGTQPDSVAFSAWRIGTVYMHFNHQMAP